MKKQNFDTLQTKKIKALKKSLKKIMMIEWRSIC
jgi:hypothetical protein